MRIEATNLVVTVRGARLLEGVSLTLAPGEIVGLIGPNGAGKTTLLRVLAGLRAPDGGQVLYDGRSVAEIGPRALARGIAYLAQGAQAQIMLRVEDVVALGRLPHRRLLQGDSAADHLAVDNALRATDTASLRERRIGTLSGGERMRVLLARALAVEAAMLFADEPMAALDPAHQILAMELLRETARTGAGVIVVLHDLTLAARFCDRVVLLDRGRVVADGGPQVLTSELIERVYGVTALRGEHHGLPYILPWNLVRGGEGSSAEKPSNG